jgi:guanylate kinase
MKPHGLLIVLSAPSGAGKTTICDALLAGDKRLAQSISATTRAPRRGERNGRDYHFLNEAEFKRLIRARGFIEWAAVHGHRYGTLKAEVARKQRAGRDVVLVIDVQGGLAVKRRYPSAVLIFVKPPSFQTLAERLRGRGTDAPEVIRTRLSHAKWEMSLAAKYDFIVINKKLQDAVRDVHAIIAAERLRVRRCR